MSLETVKVSKSRTLAKKRGIGAEAWREKGVLHSEEGRFQLGEGGQAKGNSLGEVGESMSG